MSKIEVSVHVHFFGPDGEPASFDPLPFLALLRRISEQMTKLADIANTEVADDAELIADVDQIVVLVEGIPAAVAAGVTKALADAGVADDAAATALAATDAAVKAETAKVAALLPAKTPPAPAVVVSTAALPNAAVGQPYTGSVTATGGTAPYTFTQTGGQLPAGITLNTDGTFAGSATTAGASSFGVTATDANGQTGAADQTITAA